MKHRKGYSPIYKWIGLTLLTGFVFTGALPDRTKAEPIIYPVIPLQGGPILLKEEIEDGRNAAETGSDRETAGFSGECTEDTGGGNGECDTQDAFAGESPDYTFYEYCQDEDEYIECEDGTEIQDRESGDFNSGDGDVGITCDSFAAGRDEGLQQDSVPELVESECAVESVEAGPEAGLTYLGEWTATAYCACPICCGSYSSGYTASGTWATQGRTVACSDLEFGTQLLINDHIYTVEDRGVEGAWVDIFFESHEDALAFGMQQVDVYLVS